MPYILGLFIAFFISLTGVGAGTLTVPILILFLGVPAPVAVGIGLLFATVVKFILVPAQIVRGNVSWRTLALMLFGGVPGVLVGSLFLKHLVTAGANNVLNGILGAILVGMATYQILYSFRAPNPDKVRRDRASWLTWLMLPVGAEVGFSSAGAGALGSAAILSFTKLEPAQVVGTDIAFGFILSLIGSGAHWSSTQGNTTLLWQLVIGGIFGAGIGTLLSTHIPRRPLRVALWVCLLLLGGQFLVNSYHAHAFL
ncbi:sulfite exporter TauE/SafE family protein [Acidicapsa dinghuensis]|uniref:Probable membrane transporter protein n=1 Tax=Acidicapsa dinghuensis TaxID=2218256 RepID=A0ABW1EH93_9BACT|nr:sulfite exporter TauE/SafE family protein [Acidicapsa dinghuensis]